MAELEVLRREFASLSLADEHFPIWRQWGVEDTSVAVHSLGLSYLLTIGQRAGFAACCEFPVDPSVRADCVWWQKDSHDAVAAFEFERHKNGSELKEKVENLLIAYQRLGQQPRLLSLVFWTKHFYALEPSELEGLWGLFGSGFTTKDGVRIPGADPRRLHIFECTHGDAGADRLLLREINERTDK
ncbi:MAG: hypothetical protein IID44_18845 [Planctomycetes bacterium]|nr:hypothetical protein [Planctomycetota bacterium]